MKKLHLLEEIDDVVINEVVVDKENNFAVSNLISSLIKSEWDIVDLYNTMLITLQDKNAPDVESVIEENISNHYIHIGQLEKVLQSYNVFADDIDDGKELASEE